MNIFNLITISRYVKPIEPAVPFKRKRKSTKKYALVMPYGRHKGKLLGDVPTTHAARLLKEGELDKPRYKWLKDGLVKHGKLTTKKVSDVWQEKEKKGNVRKAKKSNKRSDCSIKSS